MLRLLREDQHIDAIRLGANARDQRIKIRRSGRLCKFALPESHIEGRVLAAHEARDICAVLTAGDKREDEQRLAAGVISDHDERLSAFMFSDCLLPGVEEFKALIGRREKAGALKHSPRFLSRGHVAHDIDARDAACRRIHRCV